MTDVDALTCRSPDRCRTCEHSLGPRGCALEAELEAALVALGTADAPKARGVPVLLKVDARPQTATA